MKTAQTILLVIIGLLLFTGGYFTGHHFKRFDVPDGYLLVRKTTVDSLNNLKPVVKDTIIYLDKIVYRDRIITPEPIPNTPYSFVSDSLVTDSLWLVINDTIQGSIINREIHYKPTIFEKTIEKPVPYYVETITYKDRPGRLMLYFDIKAGGHMKTFLTGAEIGFISTNRQKIGFQMLTDFHSQYYIVSFGKRIY
jgi:hypothetical protein